MKKMLVILLILFTKVLADSDEDKYVDLLPDEEKRQFLENVARRILKDVESKENVTDAQSGEVADDELEEHNKYVKSIIKEEQRNAKNKGDVNNQNSTSASEEKEVLGVQPLSTEKTSLQNEQVSNESSSNNITVEDVRDNAPIIKRSIKDDNTSSIVQSDESSEMLQEVSQNNITSGETNELEADNEKFMNENNASYAKNSSDNVLKAIESTTAGHEVDKAVLVQTNQNDEARNVSVKAIHESRRTNEDGKLVENTTDIDTNTSTVEVVKSTEIKPGENTNVSSTEQEFTTLPSPFENSSLKGNTTESTTLDGILFESTTELTKEENDSESLLKVKNDTTKDSENEVVTKIIISTRTLVNEETTKSVPETTESVTEATAPVAETTESVTEATASIAETESVTEATAPVAETTESVTEATAPVAETTESVPETTESVTETTKPVTEAMKSVMETTEPVPESTESDTKPVTATTKSVIETTEFVPETKTESEIVTTEAPTESTSALFTTQRIPVATTKKMNIMVEDFTSALIPATTVKSTILKPKTTTEMEEMFFNKAIVLSDEVTSTPIEPDEESVEITTEKRIRHKLIVHKPVKYIVGPRAKKMAGVQNDGAQIDKFIELEKVYYGNNHTQRVGKAYHVFEIPADQSPFTKVKAPVADQPYYVPVYNYAPKNAYFNPQNRLGPNADDISAEKHAFQSIFYDDDNNNLDKTETLNVKMEYDRIYDNKRKKFGSKQKTHSIHRQPIQNTETQKSRGKVNPGDYFDSDYYFGRVRKTIARKSNLGQFPDSDESDHPAHSIREKSLKDHVRAIRNILFQQKSFGALERDNKYGASVEQKLKKGRQRHVENNFEKYAGRKKSTNKHKQMVGYLKRQNQKKKIYVMDDFFKARATLHPYIEDERNTAPAFLSKDDTMHRAGKSRNNNKIVKKDLTNFKGTTDQDDIPVNTNEDNVTKNLKLSLTKNEVLKVSVYLKVLKDMVTLDNKALVQFDWLGTTVDIQAALQKLFELNALVANEEYVHPSDMEILKYVLFIHKLASEIIEANEVGARLRKKQALPMIKRKLKSRMLKEKGLINRVWLYLRKEVPEVNDHEAIKQLNSFLIAVEDGLYDLHDAIKNVAKITKYKNQHWYQNLKDLYINTEEKQLLQILLHMTALRLFALIEESASTGLEDDYIEYMKKNRQHSKRTLDEMIFILEILEAYNKYEE